MLEGGKSLIYETCDGDKYDLSELPEEHIDFLRRAYLYYLNDMNYTEFVGFILGPNSPVSGFHRTENPVVYEVLADLQSRLGVKQECFAKDWEGDIDPMWPLTE